MLAPKLPRLKIMSTMLVIASFTYVSCGTAFAASESPASVDFEAYPSHKSTVNSSISTYFLDKIPQGKSHTEALVIRNMSSKSIDVQSATVNAVNGTNGGINYETAPSLTWIHGLPKSISIPAHGTKQVSFEINVPNSASAGDHIYGISLTDHPAALMDNPGNTASKVSVQVKEQLRRVIAVEVQVPGPAVYGVKLQNSSIVTLPSGAYLTVHGTSTSDVIQNLHGQLTLLQNGKKIWSVPIKNDEVLPHSNFTLSYRWASGTPEMGQYTTSISIQGAHMHTVKDDLSFKIGRKTLRSINQLTGQKTIQTVIPFWVYIVATSLLVLILTAAGIIWSMYRKKKRERRRRRRKARLPESRQ